MLAAAKRLAKLIPVIEFALGRVWAEFKLAAGRTVRSRRGNGSRRGGQVWGEPLAVPGKAGW